MITLELEDWLHGVRPSNDRTFHAEIDDTGKDIYIQIFDTPEDKSPLTTIHIENSNGQLLLRIWEDENGEPTKIDLPSDRAKLPYCLSCGNSWATHNDDGSCVQDD